MSSRRSSGWDGFASSSSWNTVTMPNSEPSTAKLPTAATDEPPADTRRGAQQLQQPGDIAIAEQGERDHDQRAHDEHGRSGLDEHRQPVTAAHRDDPGDAAEQDVHRQLETRAVDGSGEDREQGHHHQRGAAVEQNRHQHAHGRERQRVGQPGATGGELDRDHRDQQQHRQQEQDVVAVPELASEPPRPGQQQPDDHHRQDDEPSNRATSRPPSLRLK